MVLFQDGEKRYDSELELMLKRQKKEIERQEGQHIQQFKTRLKFSKTQQVNGNVGYGVVVDSDTTQSKDLKRFKENLKEEEKLALKRAEVSANKANRKVIVNKTKLDLHTKRQEKVRKGMFAAGMLLDGTCRRKPSAASKWRTWIMRSNRS